MKFELAPYQADVSEDDIISDLKNIARGLEKDSVTQRHSSNILIKVKMSGETFM